MMGENRSPSSLFIIDWDDTLMPTSALVSAPGIQSLNLTGYEEVKARLEGLQDVVLQFLVEALRRGPVAIVTNASRDWVFASSMEFMPKLIDVLKHITVISARDRYSHIFESMPCQWKISTFEDIIAGLSGWTPSSVISIGDGMEEKMALLVQSTIRQSARTMHFTTIMLQGAPSISEIHDQLLCLSTYIDHIVLLTGTNKLFYASQKRTGNCLDGLHLDSTVNLIDPYTPAAKVDCGPSLFVEEREHTRQNVSGISNK
eukprot:CAMPEP_0206362484 /NCGR_PEP_ID=MMETSP0294-20121207/1003_1 /ASSEMBLY_ACC=CAM_ASM_000327 /TAXON_ID=39354 /ORGANISM="Heterosigma akashiwo, Strain CCMP2393" /LENGTH=258 /DNA_ID=CAMNT_0053807605 /DNA_START=11 /DNA_END=787 /DNA_ORIENTATION=+